MMNSYLNRVLTQWTSCRIVRLLAGAMLLTEGIRQADALFISVGALFTILGLFWVNGCYGPACNIPQRKGNKQYEETTYEELKN